MFVNAYCAGIAKRISGGSSPGPAPRIRAVPADSSYRYSIVHIASSQNHGTELLLVSSNRFDFLRDNPRKHNVARSQRVTECAENTIDARSSVDSRAENLTADQRHSANVQWPLASYEFQMEARNTVRACVRVSHHGEQRSPILLAADSDKASA